MTRQQQKTNEVVFKDLLRLIFVIFSLYLLRDAFNRWDGFSYYASFDEFLPSVSLAYILWSSLAFFASIILWLTFKLICVLFSTAGLKVRIELLLFSTAMFALAGALAWKGKKILWPDLQTTVQVKSIVFFCTVLAAILVSWLLRNKAGEWTVTLTEHITPLVWLFGIFVIMSVPNVAYHAWIKDNFDAAHESAAATTVKEGNSPNIVLVTFDALAAQNMSAFGYYKETTPFISRWSKNASVFTLAEASSNFTTPAVASLMTGKRVWTHQTYHIEGAKPVRSKIESLPAVLKDNGYFNIALVVNPFASVKILGMSNSFDIDPKMTEFGNSASLFGWKYGVIDKLLYRAFGEKIKVHNWILKNEFIFGRAVNLFSRNIEETTVPPRKVFERFFVIADNNMKKPFFAWLHLFPPHDPYLPPKPFKGTISASSKMRSYKKQEHLIEESYKYLFKRQTYPEEMHSAVNLMRDYYDEFIMYVDNEFENFIQELDKRDYKNTIVILTADHGESFEHGYFTHGGPYLYEQVTHIPLIIKLPGQEHGQVVDDLVEQTDIAPTILNLVNIPVPSWMDGRSLYPLMKGEKLPDRPVFSMNFQDNRSLGHEISKGSIAVWDGDYKLILYLDREESMLFNLKEDSGEKDNLFSRKPQVAEKLLEIVKQHLKDANEKIRN